MKKRFLSCAIALLLVIACISGLSAQVHAAGNAPKITLNYEEKDVDVNRGFTLVATVEAQGTGTITWSSSNNSVASVSSSGYVSGKSAGTTTITATYRGSDGSTASKSCDVHVTVEDDLYYIKNAYSDLCMNTSGSAISLHAQETNANSWLGQLWYISYVSGYGLYSIRPISDFSLSMDVDAGNYVAVAQNEVGAYWDIVADGYNYAIRYHGNRSETAKPVVADMPGSSIYIGNWETNSKCFWKLEKAYGIFLRDTNTQKLVNTSDEIILGIGRNCSLDDLGISCEYYGNMNGGITLISNNSSIVSVNASRRLTGENQGVARITISARLNGTSYSYSCYVHVKSTVLVFSCTPDAWLTTSQTMGENLASEVGAEEWGVQAVFGDEFANLWNNTTSDHIIIHTHGGPGGLGNEEGYDGSFTTENISQLVRNSAIGFVLITACETGGQNGTDQNFASLLSQYIAEDGVVVCSTTNVEGVDTEFIARHGGEWIAYCNGEQIPCDLPTTITMALVAEYWEEFK